MQTRHLTLVALFAGLTAASAFVAIPLPFSPVPVTLQVFFSLLAGVLLGNKLGALSQVVYLLIGAIGLPVFAGGRAGLETLLGPTGGYLIGFVLAAWVVGYLSERRIWVGDTARFWPAAAWMLIGLGMIYIPGVVQLSLVTDLTLARAIVVGALPFIPVDLVKVLVAAIVIHRLHYRLLTRHP